MSRLLAPPAISAAYLEACRLDVAALKPGNVHVHAPGHGMEARHFLDSARVTAPIVADPALAPGVRIRRAVEATFAVAGLNTNLGILLLAAPIATAAGRDLPIPDMPARIAAVLAGLDHQDAVDVYAAIAEANPAGLGQVQGKLDVHASPPPGVTLLAAMEAAADRDLIASQYATGYALVHALANSLATHLARGVSKEDALARVFLDALATHPDTHIARKHGAAAAESVRVRAAELVAGLTAEDPDPLERERRLLAFDRELKAAGLNPGSLADLAVAAAFLVEIDARRAGASPGT